MLRCPEAPFSLRNRNSTFSSHSRDRQVFRSDSSVAAKRCLRRTAVVSQLRRIMSSDMSSRENGVNFDHGSVVRDYLPQQARKLARHCLFGRPGLYCIQGQMQTSTQPGYTRSYLH